jgi:Transposase DNA-binding/Transposase Tn5 dimerisation domain
MCSWIQEEFQALSLGDKRLDNRFMSMLAQRIETPASSIPKSAMGDRAEMKASYRFLGNDSVDAKDMIAPHLASTLARCSAFEYVVVPHDTTNINQSSSSLDLGHIDNGTTNGVMMHSAMAISPEGVTQGLVYQKIWGRDRAKHGQSNDSGKRPYKERESYKWEEGVEGSIKSLGSQRAIHVFDREADIHELLSMPRPANHQFIVRARHLRTTIEGAKVPEKLRAQPEACRFTLPLARGEDRLPKPVEIAVRFCTVEIKPPGGRKGALLKMGAVLAEEVVADDGSGNPAVQPVCWVLYTDIPLENAAQARWVVLLYTYRWLIERFHFTLKSGCAVEKSQLRTSFEQVQRAITLLCIVAWRIMFITYTARIDPEVPADVYLERDEWEALFSWKYKTFDIPNEPPSIGEAVRWIAMMGGYLGRNNDGPPGMKTFWQGYLMLVEKAKDWRRFKDYLSTYKP